MISDSIPLPEEEPEYAWEHAKENAQPLKEGRSRKALQMISEDQSYSVKAEKLNRERKEWEQKLKDQAGEDPLAEWIQYIEWVEVNFPTQGKGSQLIEALEHCTRRFIDDERYKNDDRYLKLWVKYADKLPHPEDVFKFLSARRIGRKCAIFYNAWALVAESANNMNLADKIYDAGLKRKAQPMGLIKQRQKQFQRRMARRLLNASRAEDETRFSDYGWDSLSPSAGNHVEGENTAGPRRALNPLSSQTAESSYRATSQRFRGLGPRPTGKPANSAVPVFVDPSFQGGSRGGQGAPFQLFDDSVSEDKPSGPVWKKLDTEQERHKENQREAAPWADQGFHPHEPTGQSLAQQPSRPGFSIFEEEIEPDQVVPKRSAWSHERPEAVLSDGSEAHPRKRQKAPLLSDKHEEDKAEKLHKDPLAGLKATGKYHQSEKAPPKSTKPKTPPPAPSTTAGVPTEAPSGAASHASSNMVLHVDIPLFKIGTAQELSFEEVRATRPRKHAQQEEEGDDAMRTAFLARKLTFDQKKEHADASAASDINRRLTFSAASTAPKPSAKNSSVLQQPLHDEDVTVNTKFALQDLEMMFGSSKLGDEDTGEFPAATISGSAGVTTSSTPFPIFEDQEPQEDLDASMDKGVESGGRVVSRGNVVKATVGFGRVGSDSTGQPRRHMGTSPQGDVDMSPAIHRSGASMSIQDVLTSSFPQGSHSVRVQPEAQTGWASAGTSSAQDSQMRPSHSSSFYSRSATHESKPQVLDAFDRSTRGLAQAHPLVRRSTGRMIRRLSEFMLGLNLSTFFQDAKKQSLRGRVERFVAGLGCRLKGKIAQGGYGAVFAATPKKGKRAAEVFQKFSALLNPRLPPRNPEFIVKGMLFTHTTELEYYTQLKVYRLYSTGILVSACEAAFLHVLDPSYSALPSRVFIPICPFPLAFSSHNSGTLGHEAATDLLLMEKLEGCSLLQLLNEASKVGIADRTRETVILLLSYFLLLELEMLHAAGVLHNDLKPDNVMIHWCAVKSTPEPRPVLAASLPTNALTLIDSPPRVASRAATSAVKGALHLTPQKLKITGVGKPRGSLSTSTAGKMIIPALLDFGISLDQALLPPEGRFNGTYVSQEFQCLSMENGDPWVFEQDHYALAVTLATLLVGDYCKLRPDSNLGINVMGKIKRYWDQGIWLQIFYQLVVGSVGLFTRAESTASLRSLREAIAMKLRTEPETLTEAKEALESIVNTSLNSKH